MNEVNYRVDKVVEQYVQEQDIMILSEDTAYDTIIQVLKDGFDGDTYADLYDIFEDFGKVTIFYADAEAMLYHYNVFDAIADIVEYEKEHFGEILTDLTDSYQTAKTLWKILGERTLEKVTVFHNNLNEQVTPEKTSEILLELCEIDNEQIA